MGRLYIAALLLVPGAAGALALDDSTYRNRALGVRVEAPEGWTLHQQTGYPSIIAIFLARDGKAAISLAVGPRGSGRRVRSFVEGNKKSIIAVGLRVVALRQEEIGGRKAWLLDLKSESGEVALRQFYLLHGSRVLVFTLTTSARQLDARRIDLAQVVEFLKLSSSSQRKKRHGRLWETSSKPNQPATRPTSQPSTRPSSLPMEEMDGELESDPPGSRSGPSVTPD